MATRPGAVAASLFVNPIDQTVDVVVCKQPLEVPLPRNVMGKILKYALRDLVRA